MDSGSLYSNMGPGMLGLEMSLHHQIPPQNTHHHLHQQPPPHPQPQPHHHPMVSFAHQENNDNQQQTLRQVFPFGSNKAKNQSLNFSDDDEPVPGVSADNNSTDDGKRNGNKTCPWQRMKWTDNMVRLLIMVVYYIGDEVGSEGNINMDDALKRSVFGQARIIEHYAELQEKYNDLAEKHKLILQGIQDVKNAAAKAGKKGHGARFAKSLAAELSALRVEREREREMLKKENKSLRVQLKDTAEAVHAAGELLVRLREAEETASLAEENFTQSKEENERLKKQIEKLKRKHKMEMITMKQYLAESRLPEAALRPPIYRQDSDVANNDNNNTIQHSEYDDDQSWRAEFGAIYQEHI